MSDLTRSIVLSLQVSLTATAVTVLLAVPLAFFLARHRFPGKSLIEAVLTLPLVLPPTVVGYFLIVLLGVNGLIGRWLDAWFDLRLIFDWKGAVVAAVIVSFPLLLIPAKAAFASIEHELEDVATLMGAGPLGIFWHVALPLARRGILSGTLLAFARSLGEFGATLMILGITQNRQTLPISIYINHLDPAAKAATWLAIGALSGISLIVIVVYNRAGRDRP